MPICITTCAAIHVMKWVGPDESRSQEEIHCPAGCEILESNRSDGKKAPSEGRHFRRPSRPQEALVHFRKRNFKIAQSVEIGCHYGLTKEAGLLDLRPFFVAPGPDFA
jgi:hypothetical protein